MQPSTFLSRKRPSKAPLRLTLFQKSPSAFLSLIGHIVKHRGVPGQFLDTGLAVQFGIQPHLYHTQGQRTELHHLLRPRHIFVFQFGQRYHLVNQSHVEGFLSIILPAQEPYLTGFLLPYDTSQIRGTETGVKTPYARTGLSENGIVRSYRQVAHHMEHVASADGKAVDRRNHGLGQRTDLFLHLQHIQTGHTVVPDISPVPFHVHVASGTKGLVARSGQHDHTDIAPLAANIERWGLNRFKRSRTGEPLVFSDALLTIGALRSGAAGAKACRRAAEVLLLAALIPLFLAALFLRIEPAAASAWPWRLLLTLLPLVLWSAGLALLLGSAAFRQTLLARLPLTFDARADAARWGAAGAMPLHLASLIERGQAVLDAVKKPQAEPPVVIDPKRLRLHGEPRHLLLICAEGLDLSAALDGAAPLAPTLAALARRSPSGRLAGERPPAAGGFEFEVLTGLSAETLEAWSFAPLRLAHAEKVQSPVWTERRMGRRTAAWLPLEADWLRLEAALPHLGFEAVWGLERINRWHSAAYGGQFPRLPCGLPDAEALLMSAADFLESAKDPHFLDIELPRPASHEAARELLASLDAGTRRFVERISGRELLVRGMLCGGGRWLFLRGGAQHEDRILPREALLAELFGSARRPAAAHSEVLSEE